MTFENRIVCKLHLRDGSFGKTLRSRKGLTAKGNIIILDSDSVPEINEKVKKELPDSFHWDERKEPLRFQKSREQPQQSLETVESVDYFGVFSDMYSRYQRRYPQSNDFVIHLWVYGTWATGMIGTPPGTPSIKSVGSKIGDLLSSPEQKHELIHSYRLALDRQMESSARDSQSVLSLPVAREYYDQGSVSVNERPVSVNERPVSVNEYPQRIIFREQSQGYSKKRKRDEEFATLCVMMNGQVVPLQVQIGSLRAALDMC